MDTHGQIGPEKPDYDLDVVATARALAAGEVVYRVLAHRMTRTEVALALATTMNVAGRVEGTGEQDDTGLLREDWPWVMVVVREKGMCWVQPRIAGSYIADKCRMNAVDADTVAMFVNDVMVGLQRIRDLQPA